MRNKVKRIVSGGQTGVDRAAPDFALANGIAAGGFVPCGRLDEDGKIPPKYPDLIETESSDPEQRTRLNVLNSDATLILTHGELAGGSKLTMKFALEHSKPVLHIDLLEHRLDDAVEIVLRWLETKDGVVLNVAGPRASDDGEIYGSVMRFMRGLFGHAL